MPDRIVIQCPGCMAKLAVSDASKIGKKIKCSKCAEVFVAKAVPSGADKTGAAKKPTPKPKKSDADEFNFDDMEMEDTSASDDEESESEAPARSSKLSGKKSVATKGKAKGKGKKKSGGNLPLIIGGVAALVLLVGVGLWLLMSGKNESEPAPAGQQPVAQQAVPQSTVPAGAVMPANPATTSTPVAGAFPSEVSLGNVGKFPRALTQLPDWLVADAPFDVKEFWITVPPDQNAAPLYLDALYEFSHHMEACFPPEVRAQRTPSAKTRYERSEKLQIQWYNPQQPKNVAERDAVLQEHEGAFQKLEAAQQRPRCVFDIGWDISAQLPMLQAAREVIRVAQLRVERDIERGDFDAVVRTTGVMLRLSRDLRTRTPMTFQAVAYALEAVTSRGIVIPALKSPGLKVSQCEDLLRLLVQHDLAIRAIDPYLTGLRGEYLSKRLLLHDLQLKTGEFADSQFRQAFGGVNETRGDAWLTALNGDSRVINSDPLDPALRMMIDVLLAKAQPADFDACVMLLKQKYQALSNSATQPYAARVSTNKSLTEKSQADLKSQLADFQPPKNLTPKQQSEFAASALEKKLAQGMSAGPWLAFFLTGKLENDLDAGANAFESDIRSQTHRDAMSALVALRRWYGTHTTPPPDIATMCREAGLNDVPRDAYGTGPLRMATFAAETPIQHLYQKDLKVLAGETVIYSVGPDGVDDKALKEHGSAPNGPGDWLFRLEIPQSVIPATPGTAAAPIQWFA